MVGNELNGAWNNWLGDVGACPSGCLMSDSIEELFFATVGLVQPVAGAASGARERYTAASAMGGATTIGCVGFTTTDLFTTWGPPSIFAVQM